MLVLKAREISASCTGLQITHLMQVKCAKLQMDSGFPYHAYRGRYGLCFGVLIRAVKEHRDIDLTVLPSSCAVLKTTQFCSQ